MKEELSEKLLGIFTKIAEEAGAKSFHINMPYICDCCQDINKDAFPYHIRGYDHLCNDCYDELISQDICIRCSKRPKAKHPKFPNAKVCNECFLKALDKLFLELDLEFKESDDLIVWQKD